MAAPLSPALVFIGFMAAGKSTAALEAAAGTVHESVRSRSACAGSFVSVSTERSGFVSVGSGFIAPTTTTGSPVVIPPSMPPARLVSRL